MGFIDITMNVIIVIWIMVAIVMGIGMIEWITEKQVGIEEVDCFDRWNNKIENMTCEKKIMCGAMSNLFNMENCGGEK